jgi:DNA-binding CsgD family transcriptional regulator/DNA-directed RNA polymerase specialized sigma24 family protein/tetratricopeptide (TPR) repeat protein
VFVGRGPELAVLAGQVRAVCRGQGRVVLIGGEPGIGKTRLAQEASARAAAAGWRCVGARASEDEGCPPYWLFRQVVRDVAAIHDPEAGQRADLAIVAPGLWRQAVQPDASAERRFEMFESVREFLADAAADSGLLVVLDDLHWADVPSLRLLRHLATGIGTARLLLLATYRDTESAGRDEFRAFLAAVAREDAVSRIRLDGLTPDEVACQLAAITGSQVAPEVAAAVSQRTHGNPFFVTELGRLPGCGASGLPEAVRDAVRARLGALTPGCRAVLCPAAVLGAAIDPSAVAVVTQCDVGTVLACLDEAAAAGLVTSGDGWQFSHDLIRETARLELPTADRLTAHARMARHLRCRADAVPAVVAHHLLESLPTGDAAVAVQWAERAAADAMAHLAWEDAAGFYARALPAAAGHGAADRCRLLRGLGVAQLRSFDVAAATATLREAADTARAANDPVLIGEVALAMEGFTDEAWLATGKQLCDEALARLPATDSPLRARLLAQRAAEAIYHWEPEAAPLSGQALAMAERVADPHALRSALRARQMACAGPDGVRERLELGARMLALGVADHDDVAVLWGRLWRLEALTQLGRISEAESELMLLAPTVTQLRSPAAGWHLRGSQAALASGHGQYDQARLLTGESVRIAAHEPANVRVRAAYVLARINGITGRDEPVDPVLEEWSPPTAMAIRSWWHLNLGRPGEARRYYRPGEALANVTGGRYLITYAAAAELAAAFGDQETAAEAHRCLLPYADLFVCGGAGLILVEGSARRFLGIAATVLGHLDEAVRHLRAAISANQREGLQACTALATFDLAHALARRRRPGDREEAAALAVSAAATAGQLGMAGLLRQTRSLSAELAGLTAGPLTRREREIAGLVARGLTSRQIGAALHISERTAENHVQHILTKLGLHTRTQIAAWNAGLKAQPAWQPPASDPMPPRPPEGL